MNELLISKYVPRIFDHLKYKDKLVHDLKMLIHLDEINILFVGETGVGKSMLIDIIIKEYYTKEEVASHVLMINSLSDLNVVQCRNDLKYFCQLKTHKKKKMVCMDDLDLINETNQQVMRNFIDKYSLNVNFVCACTNIKKVIENSTFINGPSVIEFQSELEHYIGVKHVIPCANGTDALQIALMSLNLSPGDEVITSDFTFAATVEVISLLGLTPVLVDVDEVSFNINPNEINKAITSKTKVIIPVHLFGQSANMDEILKIAKKNDLYVIEDNAQGIGSTYTSSNNKSYKTGSMGTLSATSFFPSKNLGAYGDGGAIFTNDDQLANVIRGIVNHGMYKRYYHDVIGVNSRLDSIQACLLYTSPSPRD